MGANTKIEWATHTFNPWRGCTKVSAGCQNCYAETLSGRNPGTLGIWGPNGTRVVASEAMWKEPFKWNKAAQAAYDDWHAHGMDEGPPPARPSVFCASLADVFEGYDTMPDESAKAIRVARARLLEVINFTENLDWLLLTKRPQNVIPLLVDAFDFVGMDTLQMVEDWWNGKPPPNVWLGTSIENQKTADMRIPNLLKVPAQKRFLSCEPLLGSVNLVNFLHAIDESGDTPEILSRGIHWVIVGGESGRHARPMHPDWVRDLRNQCKESNVPFLFKQWGEWCPGDQKGSCAGAGIEWRDIDFDGRVLSGTGDESKEGRWAACYRVGKEVAGRILDGREWDEFPVSHP